jgi:glycogen operon protein
MMDLVSYNNKHNEANGEGNRDGINENLSSNYGAEGYTTDENIIRFRIRQLKNMAAILLLSQGVPMILAGDEVGRSQQGNNNAYCQDNEISWTDWNLLTQNQELFRFFKAMIAFRKGNAALRRGNFFNGEVNERGIKDITWHGRKILAPEWEDPSSKVLSFTMGSFREQEPDIHVMINMDSVAYEFELPKTGGNQKWVRFADSSLTMPNDIGAAESVPGNSYLVEYFSVVILLAN